MVKLQASMYLVILSVLAAFVLALPARSAEVVSLPVRHRLLNTDGYSSIACAEAIANGLGATLPVINDIFTSDLQQQITQLVQSYLGDDSRCVACQAPNDTQALKWWRFPGWHNGIFTSLFLNDSSSSTVGLQQLPPPSNVTAASTLLGYDKAYSGADIVSFDMSGFSLPYLVGQLKLDDYSENLCLNKTNPLGLLHPRTYLLLYYRADVLLKLVGSPAPPDDWETMEDLLSRHQKAVLQDSSLPSHGLCITMDTNCGRAGDVLAAIVASFIQTMGTQQGYVFDLSVAPPAAAPLVNGTGWRKAMDLLRQLLQYNYYDLTGSDTTGAHCPAFSRWFASGECLFTIDWDIAFRWMASAKALTQPGALRVAPLPGSRMVVNPNGTGGSSSSSSSGSSSSVSSGELLKCDPMSGLCSVSANHDMLYLTSSGQMTAAVDAARAVHAKCGRGEVARMEATALAESSQLAGASPLNRAPYSVLLDYYLNISDAGSWVQSAIKSITSERLLRQQSLSMMRLAAAAFGGGNAAASSTFSTASGNDSWNASSFSETPWWPGIAGSGGSIPPGALKPYIDVGFDNATVISYMQALWHAINSPNAATDVPSPTKINWFKWALSHAALELQLSLKKDTEDAAALLVRLFALSIEAYTPGEVRKTYEAALGVQPWQASSQPDKSLPGGVIAAIVISAVVGILLLVVLAIWLQRRLSSRHHDFLGRVLAPRAGQDTTLLISDVQNSTALWEQLPEEVMDIALKLHHNTFRRLLTLYDGYESGTEGDSFILAFSDPVSAVAFAAACQVDLLLQEWPQELLEQPDGEVILVDPRDSDAAQQAAALPGDARRLAGLSITGPASLLSVLSLRLRVSVTARGTPISPQPSVSTPAPLLGQGAYPIVAASGAARGASMFDLSTDGLMRNTLINAGRSRSVDFGLYQGPHSRASGTTTIAATALAAAAAGNSSGGGGAEVGSSATTGAGTIGADGGAAIPELLPMTSFGLRGAAYVPPTLKSNPQSFNPRGVACLAPVRVGSCDFSMRPEILSAGGASAGSIGGGGFNLAGGLAVTKLFGTRGERSNCMSFGPLLPTLREVPPSPWVLPPSSTWSSALVAAFPLVPPHETPLAVMGGQALRSLLVLLPTGRYAIIAYRGLRVRMGLHTGLDDPQHIVFNKVASAFKYQGPFAETARCTIDTAPGGMVVLSSQSFARLRHCVNAPGPGTAHKRRILSRAPESFVLYAGHHVLKSKPPPPPPARPRGTMGNPFGSSSLRAAAAVIRNSSIRAVTALGFGNGSMRTPAASPVPTGGGAGGATPGGAATSANGSNDAVAGTESGSGKGSGKGSGSGATANGDGDAMAGASGGATAVVRFNVRTAAQGGDAEDDGDATAEGIALYQAVPSMLSCRLALTGSLVSKRMVQLSSLQAPIGYISVAFMYVVGASVLLTELPGPAKRALSQFQRLVYRLLGAKGGYLVEGGDGLVLAAFSSPTAAVEWALDCVTGLKKLAWEPELLSHWLCEEVLSVGLRSDAMVSLGDDEPDSDGKEPGVGEDAANGAKGGAVGTAKENEDGCDEGPDGEGGGDGGGGGGGGDGDGDGDGDGGEIESSGNTGLSPSTSTRRRSLRRGISRLPSMARLGGMATTRRVLERGLRIKVGLDTGMATHSVTEASGRLGYRGKVMNRASRVAGKAAAGQVVCTDACWRGCLEGAANAGLRGVRGSKAGLTDGPDGPDDGSDSSGSDSDFGGGLVGISLGKVALKGVSAPVELIQCMRA